MRLSFGFLLTSMVFFGLWLAQPGAPTVLIEQADAINRPITIIEAQQTWISVPLRNRTSAPIRLVGLQQMCTSEGCFGLERKGLPLEIPAGGVSEVKILAQGSKLGLIHPKLFFFSDGTETLIEVTLSITVKHVS